VTTTVCTFGTHCQSDGICRTPRQLGEHCAPPNENYCAETETQCGVNNKVDPNLSPVCVRIFQGPCQVRFATDGHCDNRHEVCESNQTGSIGVARAEGTQGICKRKIGAVCELDSECAGTYDYCAYNHRNCKDYENLPAACRNNGFGRYVCTALPPWLGRWCDPRCPADNDCHECLVTKDVLVALEDNETDCTEIGLALKLAQDEAEAAAAEGGTLRRLLGLAPFVVTAPPGVGIVHSALGGQCNRDQDCVAPLVCQVAQSDVIGTTNDPYTVGAVSICVPYTP
jgi:hypothetical protein